MDNRVNPMKASEAWMEWLMKDVTWAKVHVQADTSSNSPTNISIQGPILTFFLNHHLLSTIASIFLNHHLGFFGIVRRPWQNFNTWSGIFQLDSEDVSLPKNKVMSGMVQLLQPMNGHWVCSHLLLLTW
ncbi:hypothetical protein K1719_011963 [Acacia pycnantha]|nr:hypothetical protein K1719_011963 [Acacia pycnantha]